MRRRGSRRRGTEPATAGRYGPTATTGFVDVGGSPWAVGSGHPGEQGVDDDPTWEVADPAQLTMEGLAVSLGATPILRGVSCTLSGGEILALTGPSGAGKTTTLWAAAGGLPAASITQGAIRLDGLDVVSRDATARAGVAMIPQGNGLASVLTAFENCVIPLLELGVAPSEARARATRALLEVGLSESGDHLIDELSGGQQQRVAVARAVAARPRVLLADEPTSELDHSNRERVLDVLADLAARGCAVFLATHDPEAAARAHGELHLDDGVASRVR